MDTAFSIAAVNAALQNTRFAGKLHHYTSIGSTNTQALADAQAGAAAGQVYLADEQTAGRGRGGHTWHSEPEHGLYLSILVRPRLRSNDTLALSMLAGLAMVHAIVEVTGLGADLRWPNDLVFGSHPARKAGGILTEAVSTPTGELRHAVIGIGINLNQSGFSPDLASTATSLRLQAGRTVDRQGLAIALLRALDTELTDVETATGAVQEVFSRFAQVSSWACGKPVRVDEDGGYTGVTAGLTAEGLLRVRCHDGTEREVRNGGVREQ